MKHVMFSLAMLFIVVVSPQAIADVTVYYQPTPFPSKSASGSAVTTANIHVLNGWITNVYYGTTFQKDNQLQIGGWGDNYRTYILFDLEGLPVSVTTAALGLYAFPKGDGSTLTGFDIWRPTSSWTTSQNPVTWDTTMNWNTQPGYALVVSSNAGTNNSFWFRNITTIYNNWRGIPATYPNYGLTIMPWTQNNVFDLWRSSRYKDDDGQRPMLQLTFAQPTNMPNFKMPLPGVASPGKLSWLLTNECGGYESRSSGTIPDTTHQGNNYFSLDFVQTHHAIGSDPYSGLPPILAMAGGTILDVGGNDYDTRGYYITINHGSGYQTRYIHLLQPAARNNRTLLSVGNTVAVGDQIGIMGGSGHDTSGNPYPVHLHVNFWVNGAGTSSGNLVYAVMEGLLLKSYQTESDVDVNGLPYNWKRYYASTNTPTGN